MHLNVYIFVQNGTKQGYRLIENLRAVFGSENVYINVRYSCSLRIEKEEVFIFSLIFLENIFLYYCNLKYRITIDKRYFVIWWILVLFEIQSMSIITNAHIAVGMYFKWWREREIQTIRSISHEKNLISLISNENCFAFNFLFSGRISYYLRDSV